MSIPRVPRFSDRYRIVWDEEGVLIAAEDRWALFKAESHRRVAPLVDGVRTADEIADCLAGRVDAARVYYTLTCWARDGYLEEAREPAEAAPEAPYWRHIGVQELGSGGDRRVAVRFLGVAESDLLQEALGEHGVSTCGDGNAELTLVESGHYLEPALEAFNRESLETGRCWCLCRLRGPDLWLGPLFRPGETACWECLAERLRCNLPFHAYFHARTGRLPAPPLGVPPALERAFALLAAAEAVRFLAGGDSPLENELRILDSRRFETTTHRVVRFSSCPACGSGAGKGPRRVELAARRKGFVEDGGHRSLAPDETFERYRHLISPVTGIVRTLERRTEEDSICVYHAATTATDPRTTPLRLLEARVVGGAAGKGTLAASARVSALCEALERFCGVFRGDEERRPARLAELGDEAVPAGQLLQFSPAQYRDRDRWNRGPYGKFNRVPQPLDRDREIDWTRVWSLSEQQFRWVPTAYCYFNYPFDGARYCYADSNGCAAGNNLEEAVLQGFLELVERECVAIWWYNRLRRPAVDLASLDEPFLERMAVAYGEMNRDLWVLDLTGELGIPCFAAISPCRNGRRVHFGFGAHLEPRLGVLRAVTECNQWLALERRTPGSGPGLDPGVALWLERANLDNQPYLVPDAGQPLRPLSHFTCLASADLREDVETCVELARSRGLETLVLDQTRPEIGLSVVRVIVPGMRHFFARFAPGRLYDLPVRLGWLASPLTEQELNPIPMII